jgi:hypothetical protein
MAIMNSGIALKKTVIVRAIKKIKIFGAIFLAENNAKGIDNIIAINVPSIAISIVSIIEKNKELKSEKSGGNILEKISPKYVREFENRLIKLISKSIETIVNNKIVENIKIKVFQDHWGLKYFSKSTLFLVKVKFTILFLLILII